MDMKRILQALDETSTKPVEGANDMKKFLTIVKEGPVNTTPYLGGYNTSFLEKIVTTNTVQQGITPQQALEELKKRVGSMDPHTEAPSLEFVKKYLTKKLEEGANPHKVSLPVQMAMQHYQQETPNQKSTPRLIHKYFAEVQDELIKEKEDRRQLINQYASIIAERVRLKESGEAGWDRVGMAGVGMQPIDEMPISSTDDPNNPVIHGHEKANPMELKGRIMSARNQLQELAKMAESNDLVVWQQICKLAKGGMFMGLEQNLEQIRHGINELAAKRKRGGIGSRGIDKNI